jgi:hypothetical protein
VSTSKSWNVRPSRFPFGVSDQVVGVVSGDTRADAEKKATDLYGRNVVVELVHAGSNSSERNRSRQSGSIPRPASAMGNERLRLMTADEAQMARAVGSSPALRRHPNRGVIRLLHARTFTAARGITEPEAQLLRTMVRELQAHLPAAVVEMAGGAA